MDKTASERMKRYRERQRNKTVTDTVTENGESVTGLTGCNAVIPEGVTSLFWYTNGKREELKEVPGGCKVLSDGQVWRPGR